MQFLCFKNVCVGDFSCHILLAVNALFTLCIETCEHGDTTHCSETFIELRSKEIAGVNDTDIELLSKAVTPQYMHVAPNYKISLSRF